MSLIEGNIDGLAGPTHNYAGIAAGNEASKSNAGRASNPKAAALQGLAKMKLLESLGVVQLIMPPQPRPDPRLLTRLGFSGGIRQQITQLANSAPSLLPYVYSSSGMWAANAATVCPSVDAGDGKAHFVPANMASTPHRAMEAAFTGQVLKRMFGSLEHFVHSDPLPANMLFADEGAANHTRLETAEGGVHLFVHGRESANPMQFTKCHPARQSLAASEALGRLHGIPSARMLCLRQHADVIDAGVFHNDVISTGHESFFLYHEHAFDQGDAALKALRGLSLRLVSAAELSVEDAVRTYFFNSQIVTTKSGMTLIAPQECGEHVRARALLERLLAEDEVPVRQVLYMDVRESMRNGGGPACLRLRVPLTAEEWKHAAPEFMYTPALHAKLTQWVETHYRDRLLPEDLADLALAEEAHTALMALEGLLGVKGLYAL